MSAQAQQCRVNRIVVGPEKSPVVWAQLEDSVSEVDFKGPVIPAPPPAHNRAGSSTGPVASGGGDECIDASRSSSRKVYDCGGLSLVSKDSKLLEY